MKIYNQNIKLESSKVNKDYTICILSDIHNTKYSILHIWKNLIKNVRNEKPDLIYKAPFVQQVMQKVFIIANK